MDIIPLDLLHCLLEAEKTRKITILWVLEISIGQTNDVNHKNMEFGIDIYDIFADCASHYGSNDQAMVTRFT